MFFETQRTEGISTSDIIMRILKDYEEYILRNLKKGYKPQDMNISSFKATRVKLSKTIKEKYDNVKKKFKKSNNPKKSKKEDKKEEKDEQTHVVSGQS
jgi:choline-phosphate cytidylyltransferase